MLVYTKKKEYLALLQIFTTFVLTIQATLVFGMFSPINPYIDLLSMALYKPYI